MKSLPLLCFCLLLSIISIAQPSKQQKDNRILVGVPVVYQPDQLNDGTWLLLLKKRTSVKLIPNQTFVLRGVYRTIISDTATVGTGKVGEEQKTKYTAYVTTSSGLPQAGDIAFLLVNGLKVRKDVFFHLGRYHIELTTVTDSLIYTADEALQQWTTSKTNAVIKAIQHDLSFTVDAMRQQGDNQDRTIEKGRFKDKKVFDVMAVATPIEIQRFLNYIYAYKHLYWGKQWKASEVYATWLANGAPY